jgi:imidazolonepropionase-like amidohydrolase
METPGIMMQAEAMVCITTDAPVVPIDGLRDTLIMAVRAGLPEDRALETITINPARVLELDDRVGSLKVGKDADFLIFNGHPLDGRNKVMQTYIDGKCVYLDE